MTQIISFLTNVVDPRQAHKVAHSLSDIIMIVFFAHLAKCDNWEEIHVFAKRYEIVLKQMILLENGLISKDTIRWGMQVIHPDVLKELSVNLCYKRTGLKMSRFIISLNFPFYVGMLL